MKKAGKILAIIGIVLVVIAVVWHLVAGSAVGNPLTPKASSPSNVAVFGNALMLMAILVMLGCCKKE